jgi:hypothetical protein
MNERIRELSEQAQLYARQGMAKTVIELKRYDADAASERYAKDFEQKFAELIVRECANIAREWSDDYVVEDTAPKQVDMFIKQHFGVEE